ATKTAEFAILVTEPTPFGLHDLTLAVETLRILKIPFAVVLNRSGDHDHDVEDYCAQESIPLWAKIPDQRRIAHLYSQGKLLYEEVPEVLAALRAIKTNLEALS
ncbi:MAG: ATPase, partial [Candidatus Cloacimonetes bacterium]|nr:ATPase [Candidatus Cloacimonadota bacterium]